MIDPRIYLIRQLVAEERFKCTFRKRGDGSLRTMTCCVRGSKKDNHEKHLLAVWDVEKNADRQIPVDALISLEPPNLPTVSPGGKGGLLLVSDLQRLELIKWTSVYGKALLNPLF